MSSFKSYMPWPEQTSYEMNYNITNFDLKKKRIWKCTANDSIELKTMEKSKTIDLKMFIIYRKNKSYLQTLDQWKICFFNLFIPIEKKLKSAAETFQKILILEKNYMYCRKQYHSETTAISMVTT